MLQIHAKYYNQWKCILNVDNYGSQLEHSGSQLNVCSSTVALVSLKAKVLRTEWIKAHIYLKALFWCVTQIGI